MDSYQSLNLDIGIFAVIAGVISLGFGVYWRKHPRSQVSSQFNSYSIWMLLANGLLAWIVSLRWFSIAYDPLVEPSNRTQLLSMFTFIAAGAMYANLVHFLLAVQRERTANGLKLTK